MFLLTHCESLLLKDEETITEQHIEADIPSEEILDEESMPALEEVPSQSQQTNNISSETSADPKTIGYQCLYHGLSILNEQIRDMPNEFLLTDDDEDSQPFIVECLRVYR